MEVEYVSPAEALIELRSRQKAGMRERVVEWWGKEKKAFPPLPNEADIGILARQVATFRKEDAVFRDMARSAGFTPLWLENTHDRFSTASPYKRSLLHPKFIRGRGRGGFITERKKLADISRYVNRRLDDIHLSTGESLVSFHHRAQDAGLGRVNRIDLGNVFTTHPFISGSSARYYYPRFLSLFVAHAVLFEDYEGGESGIELPNFTQHIFRPAWQRMFEELGTAPLLVRLPWSEDSSFYPFDPDGERIDVC